MVHNDHDISFFVALFNVGECTSVDDRLEPAGRGKFCNEIHARLLVVAGTDTNVAGALIGISSQMG